MKTKNRVISGLLISAILASGLFAKNDMEKNGKNYDDSKCMMKDDKMNNHRGGMFNLFKELNLSTEQKTKINEIMQDNRKNMKTSDEAFSKDSFDKAKYIEIMSEKRDNMIKSEADMIEKTYAILTAKQKEQLKVLIDLRKEKLDKKL